MRKLIAAFKISVDGKTEGSEGYADWVEAWSEDFDLMPQVDACVVGGGMYPNYEKYWTAIQDEPTKPNPMGAGVPTRAEVEWARFAAQTPHYVLSNTLTAVQWPNTSFLRDLDDIAALKEQQPGKDIYLMGGAQITASCIEAGLVDELRLIVYPLIAGDGAPLFGAAERRGLELRKVQDLPNGKVSLTYGIG
jgi:dihydrofolate reductase